MRDRPNEQGQRLGRMLAIQANDAPTQAAQSLVNTLNSDSLKLLDIPNVEKAETHIRKTLPAVHENPTAAGANGKEHVVVPARLPW